jgi:hypothetical protein
MIKKPSLPALLLGLAALALAGWLFGPRGTAVRVESKTWRLEIEIEKRIAEAESGWCDALPAEASNIQRRWITANADNTRDRTAPTEHCRYTLPQWRALRMAQAEGRAPTAPHWPDTSLNEASPQDSARPAQLGDERLGQRRAFYEIQLRAASGQSWSCRLALPQWQAQVIGSTLRLQVDRYGVANCASL